MAVLIIPCGALTAFTVSLCEYIFPLFFTIIIGAFVSMASFILLGCALNIINIKTLVVLIKSKVKFPKIKLKKKPKLSE